MGFIINNPAARNAKKYYQKGPAPQGSKSDATSKRPASKVVAGKAKPVPKGKVTKKKQEEVVNVSADICWQ